jgi:hypothetical protein
MRSVPLSFVVSPHDRLLFLHLLQPLEEDIVVVVAFLVEVVRRVVASPSIELGVSEYIVGKTNIVVVSFTFVCSETEEEVADNSCVVSRSFAGSLPRHRLNNSNAINNKGIILLSIV